MNIITNNLKNLIGIILFLFSKLIVKNKKGKTIVLCLHKLGDTILTFPAIKNLIFSNKDIVVVCFSDSAKLFNKLFPDLDIYVLNWHDIIVHRFFSLSAIFKLRELKPYKIYDLTGSILTISFIAFSGAKKVIGSNETAYKKLYNSFIPLRTKPHLLNRYIDATDPKNKFQDINIEYPAYYKSQLPIYIHPFAGWEAKEWGIKNFIKLYNELIIKYDVKLVGPANSLKFNPNVLKNNISFIETNNLDELINELKNCSIIISNDSGPIHLAAYLGKPTFTIYGPTNPDFSTPLGKYHRYIREIIPCSPLENNQYCGKDAGRNGCEKFLCMEGLDVKKVLNSVEQFIQELESINEL